MPPAKDNLKARLARVVLTHVLEKDHLTNWLDTLGQLGSPPDPKEKNPPPPQTRVTAAKAGVDLVTKFIGDSATTEAGVDLMKELMRIEEKTADADALAGPDTE